MRQRSHLLFMPQDKIEENNSIIENVNIENHEQEETTSYDFLDPKKAIHK